jgi:putative hydrolase of the HAD superfamily
MAFKEHISLLLSSESVGIGKPDPAIFLHAAERLGCEPAQCWYVGDHPVNDVVGARAAGMNAIWLEGFHSWPALHPFPSHSITALHEATTILISSVNIPIK